VRKWQRKTVNLADHIVLEADKWREKINRITWCKLQMKNSFSHKKILCAQTEAEASEEPQLETKQCTMKEISLAFRDIAEGVERFEKMDCNTPRTAMRKTIASYRNYMEKERR
jgi:hypothetical protein